MFEYEIIKKIGVAGENRNDTKEINIIKWSESWRATKSRWILISIPCKPKLYAGYLICTLKATD